MNVKKLPEGLREDGGAAGVSTSRTGDSPYFRSVLAEGGAAEKFSVSGGLRSQLKQVFGYDDFRPLQREIMEAVVAGRDVAAILPTGAGKSLCYQLPALVCDGLTVVVSPLIALMKDQVDQLQAAGVAATFINSTLDGAEMYHRLSGLDQGRYKLLYVAPERLMMPDFLPRLGEWKAMALAVDEAHCISEWGHDFRPEYRQISQVREKFPHLSILALTATATEQVRGDIVSQLKLRSPEVFIASFNRPNLSYRVIPKSKAVRQVWEFARARADESGIVYCQARKTAESLALALRDEGLSAVAYHAGLEPSERARNQDAFLRDEAKIVCATVAFGMGINKPNVRYVIHADLPKNLEGYYQETGRAGRDGLPSDCLLLFSRADVVKNERFFNEISDPKAKSMATRQLRQMAGYAQESGCRRVSLLGYFGEAWPDENCGSCDNCLEPREMYDATIDAQKLLSCIFRIQQHSKFSVGLQHVADVLCGGETEKVSKWGHKALSTYGVGRDQSRAVWVALGRQLIRRGWACLSEDGYATVSVTPAGMTLLKERTPVMLAREVSTGGAASARTAGSASSSAAKAGDIPCDEGLFQELRLVRKRLADDLGVPPYVVFSDVTLRHLARLYPERETEFLTVPGVGEKKLKDFGRQFMAAVSEWLTTHQRQSPAPLAVTPPPVRKMKVENALSTTAAESLRQWRAGRSAVEIAAARDLGVSTIETHLATAIESGVVLDPRAFYTEAEEAEMRKAFAGHDSEAMSPVFAQLDGRLSYGQLRIFRVMQKQGTGAGAERSGRE